MLRRIQAALDVNECLAAKYIHRERAIGATPDTSVAPVEHTRRVLTKKRTEHVSWYQRGSFGERVAICFLACLMIVKGQ